MRNKLSCLRAFSKKAFLLLAILLISFGSFSQAYIKVFRIKDSNAAGAKFSIKFNGREVAELRNGQKLEYQIYSEGSLLIDISAPNISRERHDAIEIEVLQGETYYVEASINEYLELYFKSVNIYQGKSKFNNAGNFKKSDALITLKEDRSDPIIISTTAKGRQAISDEYISQADISAEAEIQIQITEPNIKNGNVPEFFGETLIVKGNIENVESLDEISVNGTKAQVLNDGTFEASVLIDQFLESDVSVKAFSKSGKYQKVDFKVKRVLSEYDMAKRERQGKDYALIFATDEFDEFKNLTNPIFDASRIGKELEDNFGFITENHFNNTQKDIYLTLKEYTKKAFHPDDQLLIFFAGHGDFDYLFSEGYVVCKDTKKDDEARSSYISHSNLRTIINSIPCNHIFLVMDVCFGGTFDPVVAARGDEYSEADKEKFIKRKMEHKTRLYLTSGGKEYVPDGRPGMHSPFAKSFIQALIGGGGDDGILTFGEMLQFVEKTSPEPQSGEFGDNELGSDFLFIVK